MDVLAGRRIVLGVTGGIAAYKAAELVGRMTKDGADVRVIMTRSAQKFISPLTLSTLSGHPVSTDLFGPGGESVPHIDLAREADLLVLAPATANVIGKIAAGIADDLLTTVVLACTAPVLVCPAMNCRMFRNPIVQMNIEKLKGLGFHFVPPESGRLACGEEGPGRLASVDKILAAAGDLLNARRDFAGCRVLVTAGPTREPLDPVRFLSNRSSGRMGYAVAAAAAERGAGVVLVSGPTALAPPAGVTLVQVTTAREMLEAVLGHFPQSDVVIKAAAVADYRPRAESVQKIKKSAGELRLELERNPDILAELGRRKGRQILVGFAAETEAAEENAMLKARAKGADFIVANDVTAPGAGFDVTTNVVSLVYPDGRVVRLPQMDKKAVAHHILDAVAELRRGGAGHG
ncbi:MAG: bifunctional phosphopantothenoylcysteine decarboxylase/phosphopantothenate--cysteine ligase CoaBC [Bacillota bacterium]